VPVKTQPDYDTEQIENDLSAVRGAHDALNEYAELTTAVVGGVLAVQQPGTTHSLAGDGTPMTQEGPHSLTLSINSWSGTLRYWLNSNNTVHISVSGATAGSPANGVTIATLPVGYRPTALRGFAIGCDTQNANVGANMTVSTGGAVQATGITASSTGVFAEADIPLF
jgi:hypothetical protein